MRSVLLVGIDTGMVSMQSYTMLLDVPTPFFAHYMKYMQGCASRGLRVLDLSGNQITELWVERSDKPMYRITVLELA